MSPRPGLPASQQAAIALCLLLSATAMAVAFTATADAANYKTVFCAGGNRSGDPVPGTYPGFFRWFDNCGTAYADPAGSGGWLRIQDNAGSNAGEGDYMGYSWWAPSDVAIIAVSAYTRMPHQFHDGWRGRIWAEGFDGSRNNLLMQGNGVRSGSLGGIGAPTNSSWTAHPWPFGSWGDYKRLNISLACYRPSGCSRDGLVAFDFNTITVELADRRDAEVDFADTDVTEGGWVRGEKAVSWLESDKGSGLRLAQLHVDDAPLGDARIDYQASGGCRTGSSGASGEFAPVMDPCTKGPYRRWYGLNTEHISDGEHELEICVQDYGQYRGNNGTGSETCDRRTIRTDNTAPGKPASLRVTSANPHRYLPNFGASFSLPPDPGSPIRKVHYDVVDAAGKVVAPKRTISATDPTSLSGAKGPAQRCACSLRVWLEDEVGHLGPAASAPVPRDTTPPAAPQGLRVAAASTERRVERFGLRWRNTEDPGSPIDTARYQLLDGSGKVVKAGVLSKHQIDAIEGLRTPPGHDDYTARVWLADAEGNVGAAATVELPRDTEPPAAPQHVSVASPDTPRSREGFDLRWRNITDEGSPIVAAHYKILNGAGKTVVPTETARREDISKIDRINPPGARGIATLKLWLSDGEGNVGAPTSVPLSYDCVRSEVGGGEHLSAALGSAETATVEQGRGATLHGRLRGSGGSVAGASLCIFGQIEGDHRREFLGVAMTDAGGSYRFAVGAGPSRTISALYRPGQRRMRASARIRTKVKPTLRAAKQVVRTGEFARLSGEIPGPRNDDVVVVLQVRQGKGWLAFRRYRTRDGGKFKASYFFRRTTRPTTYEMRAQVRETGGYPYVQGDSDVLYLRVLPKGKAAARRCPKGRRWAKRPRRGKPRCVRKVGIHKRCVRARRAVRRHPRTVKLRRRAHRLCTRSARVRQAKRRAARRAARAKTRKRRSR